MDRPDSRSIFVYGTLMRGQCRERCWPRPPKSVVRSFVRGCLFDLGDYPAMIEGTHWIEGERWEIAISDLEQTLHTLDEIEGFGQDDEPDLYVRATIRCVDEDESTHNAMTYLFADPNQLHDGWQVPVSADGRQRWFRPLSDSHAD